MACGEAARGRTVFNGSKRSLKDVSIPSKIALCLVRKLIGYSASHKLSFYRLRHPGQPLHWLAHLLAYLGVFRPVPATLELRIILVVDCRPRCVRRRYRTIPVQYTWRL